MSSDRCALEVVTPNRTALRGVALDPMNKFLLGGITLFVLSIGTAMVVMPSEFEVKRSLQVTGTPAEVYAVAADLHTWPEWTVWSREADPSAVWDWSGEPASVGSTMSWNGDVHEEGRMTITDAQPGKTFAYDLIFVEDGQDTVSSAKLVLSAVAGGTHVDWVMTGELGGPFKLMGPMMDSLVGPMLSEGLTGLEEYMKGLQAN
jgi:hypothetical protein